MVTINFLDDCELWRAKVDGAMARRLSQPVRIHQQKKINVPVPILAFNVKSSSWCSKVGRTIAQATFTSTTKNKFAMLSKKNSSISVKYPSLGIESPIANLKTAAGNKEQTKRVVLELL